MLRDRSGRPSGHPSWFDHHGNDAESVWDGAVPLLTPTERFFVRNHTNAPQIDAGAWRLLVTGDGVVGERVYSLDDLRSFTTRTYERAIECTGNGRRLFGEQQGQARPGTPWGLGAIGVATWTGVPLRTVLMHAGVLPDAVEVTGVGLDDHHVADGVDWGHVRRPLPIAKALDDVLLAWEMNGAPLPRDHGHPVRLVVPGWVGVASIKWLGELRVTTTRVESPWNSRWYRMHGPGWEGAGAELGRMPVKSVLDVVGSPAVGRTTVLRGRAWAGEASIRTVEVSTDGGRTWTEASLTGANEESAWVAWEHPWAPDRWGTSVVVTRATDSRGRTQPEVAPDNEDGYLFWATVRTSVVVARTPATVGV